MFSRIINCIFFYNIHQEKMGNQINCCGLAKKQEIVKQMPISLVKLKRQSNRSQQIDDILKNATLNQQIFSLENFKKISQIGQGGFAVVYLVELKQNIKKKIKIEYALKQIPKKKIFSRRVAQNIKLEKKVLAELKNNFIISLEYSFQDSKNCYLVMQYAHGGDLYSFVSNRRQPNKVKQFKNLGQFVIKLIVGCVILAFEVLHKHQIMYRDLKPENILIFSNGYPKLADFGLAKKSTLDQQTKTLAGTKIYFAPQVLDQTGYNRYVDFWALGVFLYELLIYQSPFNQKDITKAKYKNICKSAETNRDWKNQNISQEAKDIINSFLKVNPEQRLGVKGFDEIKNHPFFKDLNWQKLAKMEYQSPLKPLVEKYKNNQRIINNYSNMIQSKQSQSYDIINSFTYRNPLIK